jgi:hypothetical protein
MTAPTIPPLCRAPGCERKAMPDWVYCKDDAYQVLDAAWRQDRDPLPELLPSPEPWTESELRLAHGDR